MATPDTSGWNVTTTSQRSSDGKEQFNTTLATTDAVKDIHGGKSTFSGKNEVIESHRHDGDDKNYTTTSGHASNTVLKERIVTGDANNGRTESTSNTTTSSSSKIVTSSKHQSDNVDNDDFVQEFEGVLNSARRSVRENTNKSNANNEHERIPCADFDKEYFNSKSTNKSTSNQQSSYEIRRNSASSTTSSLDAKKIQRETEYLANAPGHIVSRSVEYPDANTKVITETKTLPDGSTVTTTKYETRATSSTSTSKSSKQEKSSTSRVVTEDRAERNRIEVIAGDNKNVIDEVVKSRRIIDGDDKQSVKAVPSDTYRDKSVKRESRSNEKLQKEDTQSEIYTQEFTRKDNSHDSHDKVRHEEIRAQRPVQSTSDFDKLLREKVALNESSNDRSMRQENENLTSRIDVTIESNQRRDTNKRNEKIQSNTENVYDKVSTEKHRTVKKDLSQENEHYTKTRAYETDLPEEQFDRQPVQEEIIVPKKEVVHVCSPSHDHSPKSVPKPDFTNKRISVDHNPTHEAFARSLRCVTPEIDKRSVQSSTHSMRTSHTDRDHRSPSRDTNVSDTSKFSSTTVTKSYSPNRKSSPDKRKSTISSETIDISSSDQQSKNSKKTETVRKDSQTFISSKQISQTEDLYDHPRNNRPVNVKSSPSSGVYDIPTNNSPVHTTPIRKHSSGQPSYSRPTASSARHNTKPEHDDSPSRSKKQPKDNDEPIYETIADRRRPSRIDSQTTYTTSVTRETKDYRNADKLKKQTATQQSDYEPNFESGRSNSPTSSVSDIEYVNLSNTSRTVTDLDEIEIITNLKINRNQDTQDGLLLSTHKKRQSSPSVESDTDTIVEHNGQANEPFYLVESQTEKIEKTSKIDDVKETRRQRHPLTRSETYEERCRTMLGMKADAEEFTDERETVKNVKQASVDLITSERKGESGKSPRSPTKSPDRKSVNQERSPSQSPERKSKISTKSTSVKQETTTVDDHRFDTFTRAKSQPSSSPKRTPLERNDTEPKIVSDTSTFTRKSSKITTTSPDRSNSSSPERKKKPSDYMPEVTKEFLREESRSNSFRSTKTKEKKDETTTTVTTTTSKSTREVSPKREPKSNTRNVSPKRSPNRSPNTSPSRKSQVPKESIVETTKKMLNSESDVLVRKSSKSELKSTVSSRPINEIREGRDVKIVQSSKTQNKTVKEPLKSPTRVDRTSPTRTQTDETFIETNETFFSETKADTIKRRPDSKGPAGKPNATSPDRKPVSKTSTVPSKEPTRKSVTEEVKVAPKKPTNLSLNTDNQVTTNTFTRRKPSEPTETLPSPTKPKGKLANTPDNSSSSPVTSVKNIPSPSKVKTKPAKADVKSKSKPKSTNNYSTDDDSEEEVDTKKSTKKIPITERKDSAPVYRSTKVDKEVKMARSTSEHFSASRKGSKPDIETPKSPQKIDKRPTKCVTTKTINLSTTNALNSEDIIIDIQQAKSSREPTPNRIIPTPVSPEEVDTGKPRYPDTVHEPDDEKPQRRPVIKNIPIFEEDTKEFISCHITEVSEDYDGTDSDECMLSVSDKVTKFTTKINSPSNDKFKRTVVETVNEFSEDVDDECKLSVQGKVSRFTAIAEEDSTTKCSKNTKKDCDTTKVNEKVAQFTAKEVRNAKTSKPEPVRNTERVTTRRDFEDIDETLRSDDCLLSVSDKVNKFVATAESLTASVPQISDQKSPELVAKVHRQISLRDKTTKKNTEKPSDLHDSGLEKPTTKGKITDRYVPNKAKPTPSTASVPISLSSINVVKAKSIFEREDSPKAPKQRDILSRPSIWEHKRSEAAKADVKLTGKLKTFLSKIYLSCFM